MSIYVTRISLKVRPVFS